MTPRASFRSAVLSVTLLALLGMASPAWAVRIEANDKVFLDVHYLIQPHLQLTRDSAMTPATQMDFYIRRSRIMLGGQVSPYVSFFMETDQPNWGKDGDWTSPMFVQDAWVSFDVHESLHVVTGMVLPPFVHHSRQGATTLHTLDYHGSLIRYPAGAHKVWRDMGVEFWGLLANQHIDYRVSITNGVPGTVRDLPRLTGRLQVNILDAETGYFYGGTYLAKKKVLSFGGAVDVQPDAFGEGEHYIAGGADLFLDLPVGKRHRLSGQLDYVVYGGGANPDAGMGLLFDLGFAIGPVEPIIAVDWYLPRGAEIFDEHLLGGHLGLNWWVLDHNASIKLDVGLIKGEGLGMDRVAKVVTLQTQLLL